MVNILFLSNKRPSPIKAPENRKNFINAQGVDLENNGNMFFTSSV